MGSAIALVGEDCEVCNTKSESNTTGLRIMLAVYPYDELFLVTYETTGEAHVAGMSCLDVLRVLKTSQKGF